MRAYDRLRHHSLHTRHVCATNKRHTLKVSTGTQNSEKKNLFFFAKFERSWLGCCGGSDPGAARADVMNQEQALARHALASLLVLLCSVPGVEAVWDAGDTVMLITGATHAASPVVFFRFFFVLSRALLTCDLVCGNRLGAGHHLLVRRARLVLASLSAVPCCDEKMPIKILHWFQCQLRMPRMTVLANSLRCASRMPSATSSWSSTGVMHRLRPRFITRDAATNRSSDE